MEARSPQNKDYWQQRADENALKVFEYSQRNAQLVTRWFNRAKHEMQQKINDFYRRYAEKERISLQAAKLTLNDRKALNLTLEECRLIAQKAPLDGELKKMLDKAYLSRAISREEFLMMQLNMLASELYGEYADLTKRSLNQIFEESYYKSIFDYQQFIGFGSSFNRISANQIQAAYETAWKGKNYSERIWGDHRVSLARYLNRIVTNGFIQGSSNAEMTVELEKAMDMGSYEARRLIRTECTQVSVRANLLAYKQNGTPRFEFLATLDYKTSKRCREMDGKVFAVSKGKIGENIPPLHPFCRSTTVPYIPDSEFDQGDTRAARNGRGETYKVPADMNYREWYKTYVKSDPEELLSETKYQKSSADKKQFAKYKTLLGDDAPKSLDEMQLLKYTNADGWNDFKAFTRYKRKYPHSNRTYYEINKEIQMLRQHGTVEKSIGIAVPPTPVKIESYDAHALERMFERGFGTEKAASFIENAIIEFRQFQGTRSAFYSKDGVAVVLRSNDSMVTGWDKTDFNDGTDHIWEVLKKHGKG